MMIIGIKGHMKKKCVHYVMCFLKVRKHLNFHKLLTIAKISVKCGKGNINNAPDVILVRV